MKFYATKISENISETPEGFLICIGVPIARTGIQEYAKGETPIEPGPKGLVEIDREEAEVFRKETIASFEGKPFTIKHPDGFVTPENWKDLAKGMMQNIRRGDGEFKDSLIADLLINDAEAISLVKKGMRGLSCGYEAEYIQTGDGKGKQINIIGNHLALVDEGRAGEAYAINDHKGAFSMSKLKEFGEKLKSGFSKVIDESMKEEPKEDKGKDDCSTKDAAGYDELVKIVKDLAEKVTAMGPKKDQASGVIKKEKGTEEGKDDAEEATGLEARLAALEEKVTKLLNHEAEEGSEHEQFMDGESEETDDDAEEKEEKKSKMVGDTASRAEILAPGIKVTKDVKSEALKIAYKTDEGKKIIDSLTNGKPTFDSADKVDILFNAASDMLKVTRGEKMTNTRRVTNDFQPTIFNNSTNMTAEKMNEINAKRYNLN